MSGINDRRDMTSLVNITGIQPVIGVYVLECQDGALYTGMSENLQRRMQEHAHGCSSQFVKFHGGPARVLELRFCETKEDAYRHEFETARQLSARFPNKCVYTKNHRNG
jgi:predicted GIY-YIG superfamily endonuclease